MRPRSRSTTNPNRLWVLTHPDVVRAHKEAADTFGPERMLLTKDHLKKHALGSPTTPDSERGMNVLAARPWLPVEPEPQNSK